MKIRNEVGGKTLNPHSKFAQRGFIGRRIDAALMYLMLFFVSIFFPEIAHAAAHDSLGLTFKLKPDNG